MPDLTFQKNDFFAMEDMEVKNSFFWEVKSETLEGLGMVLEYFVQNLST